MDKYRSKIDTFCLDCGRKIDKGSLYSLIPKIGKICSTCADIREWESNKECYKLWYEYLKLSNHYQSLCDKIIKLEDSIQKATLAGDLKEEFQFSAIQSVPYYLAYKTTPPIERSLKAAANSNTIMEADSAKLEYGLFQRYYAYFGNVLKTDNFDYCWQKIMHRIRFIGLKAGDFGYPEDLLSVSVHEEETSISQRYPIYIDMAAGKQKLLDDFKKFLDVTHGIAEEYLVRAAEPFPLKLDRSISDRNKKFIKTYLQIYIVKKKFNKTYNDIAAIFSTDRDSIKDGIQKARRILKNVESGIFPGNYSGK